MHYLRVSGVFIPRLRVGLPHPGFFNGVLALRDRLISFQGATGSASVMKLVHSIWSALAEPVAHNPNSYLP